MKQFITALCILVAFSLFSPAAAAQEQQELTGKWKKWLREEVGYIISEHERDVFLKLTTDEQRERFAEEFWEVRDPTPGTDKNERKDEHYARLAYANKYLGRDTPRPGWMTDRGKYYIILGKPKQIQSFPSGGEAYPCELWFYQADPRQGIPPFFYLLFFQRHGSGEYVLYNPMMDGPTALTTGAQATNDSAAYDVLYNMNPELANASISFLVDENVSRGNIQPSLGTLTLFSQIENAKNLNVDTSYADRILMGQARIETQYVFNSAGLDTTVFPAVSDFGASTISYAFQMLPQQMNVGQYNDTVYGSLLVDARVATPDGLTISERSRTIELDMKEEEFEQIRKRPLLFVDQIPAVPGKYSVSVQVKNPLTKEMFLMTRDVEVPDPEIAAPTVGPLLLGIGSTNVTEAQKNLLAPFQYGILDIVPNPSGYYAKSHPAFLYCQVAVPAAMRADAAARFEVQFVLLDDRKAAVSSMARTFAARQADANGLFHIATTMPLDKLNVGKYIQVIKVTFLPGGENFTRSAEFAVGENELPPPNTYTGEVLQPANGALDYAVGEIWKTIGNTVAAEKSFARAATHSGNKAEYALAYAGQLLESGKYREVLETLEAKLVESPRDASLLLLAGRAYLGEKEFSRAVKMFERLRREDGGSVQTLNLLADAYQGAGNREKAVELWRLSLEKDGKQDDIKKKLEGLNQSTELK